MSERSMEKTDDEAQNGSLGPFRNVGLVECVECPQCGFMFAAVHTVEDPDFPGDCWAYSCDCGYSAGPSAPKKFFKNVPCQHGSLEDCPVCEEEFQHFLTATRARF